MSNVFKTPMIRNRKSSLVVIFFVATCWILACNSNSTPPKEQVKTPQASEAVYTPPDTSTIPNDSFGVMVRYGRDLIVNTAYYIGPNGIRGHYLGNKMNCENCHVNAGTQPYAYNYFSTHARYPQYRARENKVLSLGERINNCIERPHNGKPLPLDSRETQAMLAYMRWVSANVPVGQHVKGDDELDLELPKRAADPDKGAVVFAENCSSCHGKDGQGQWNADSSTYIYPPLWGPHAYQKGSSPHRVLKLAGFIKAYMPYKKASWDKPFLTDEQAIDVAAFIDDDAIHPRPVRKDNNVYDYGDYKMKAIDYDQGPFADTFSAHQHKYGPYQPIIDYDKAHHLPVSL